MSNIDIKLPDNWNGSTVTVLNGKALDPVAPKQISLTGTLQAPYQFLEGKLNLFNPDGCHLKIFYADGQLVFVANDTHPYDTHIITGVLKRDSRLDEFQINCDHRWTVAAFLKFIKTMRYYFADPEAHKTLVESLQKWSVTIQRVIKEHNDNRGNSDFQLQTKVQQDAKDNLITKFNLNIPIFQGYPKRKFSVEIGLDPKAVSVELYLISDELIELEIAERQASIDIEVGKFKDFPCSKVTIN